jgi:hypothetical protein
MKNAKLNSIIAKAASNLVALAKEDEDKILAAWQAAEQEAQENETKPKFKLGFAITLDLDKNALVCDLVFGSRRKRTTEEEIPDPNATPVDVDVADEEAVTKGGA